MATIRRKTIEKNAAEFLSYARVCGVDLSWNNYERMLPQDGFARLGLSCSDCLMGPCRINPFDRNECKTVCGLDKNDLAYRSLMRLIGAQPCNTANYVGSIINACKEICDVPFKSSSGCAPTGLGNLQEDMINICFESVPWDLVIPVEKAGAEAAELAASVGAKGFKFTVVGACCPVRSTLAGYGDIEFAVLTGLLDGYVLGRKAVGLGKNAAARYHTAVICDCMDPQEILKKAAEAYANRNKALIRPDSSLVKVPVTGLADLAEEAKKYDKIVVFGGGANIKRTVGELTVNLVKALSEKGIGCFTFDGAAVTVGKTGLTENVYYTGGKVSGILLHESIKEKVCAVCVPELMIGDDLARAIYMGECGLKVITATELPIEGAPELADAIHERVEYCDSAEYMKKVLSIVG